jgi:hypothetical protein
MLGAMTQSPSFTRRRENFTCLRCGTPVRGSGYTNHCPRCLWSRHVSALDDDRDALLGLCGRPVPDPSPPSR